MKKPTLWILFALLSMALAACSTTAASKTASSTTQTSSRSLSQATKLALGTFKLDKSASPITPDEAKNLLPVWKGLRSLSESDTAAAEEIQGLIDQIGETMTSNQVAAIDAMQLSDQDMQTVAQEFGLNLGYNGQTADPAVQATRQAARQSGQGGQEFRGGGPGGFPGMEGGGPGGANASARQSAVAQNGATSTTNVGISSTLLEAVIQFLSAKIQ